MGAGGALAALQIPLGRRPIRLRIKLLTDQAGAF